MDTADSFVDFWLWELISVIISIVWDISGCQDSNAEDKKTTFQKSYSTKGS